MLESQNGEINTKNNQALKDATDTIDKRTPPPPSNIGRLADQAKSNPELVHAALQNKKNNTCAIMGRTNHKMMMDKFERLCFL